jgi:putative transposase
MTSIESLRETVGIKAACEAIGLPRATFYRKLKPLALQTKGPSSHPSSLSLQERQEVLDVLNQPEWMDQPPLAVYTSLLDQGIYLCSVRTMYRILQSTGEVKERRNQRSSTTYQKPELLATAPNQLWSWDITKLKGPRKWSYFYLYVIMDVFSRYAVGWMISLKESSQLAQGFISETLEKQSVPPHQLTLHADRGSSMTSKPVAFLLADLGVTKSHSRPYTSNDNPFSESQFKTLKYRPEFPDRFGSIEDARAHCQVFFHWYNTQHYHSGIEFLTPQSVHYGNHQAILDHRNQVRDQARQTFPGRFKGKKVVSFRLPSDVWINPPESKMTP